MHGVHCDTREPWDGHGRIGDRAKIVAEGKGGDDGLDGAENRKFSRGKAASCSSGICIQKEIHLKR